MRQMLLKYYFSKISICCEGSQFHARRRSVQVDFVNCVMTALWKWCKIEHELILSKGHHVCVPEFSAGLRSRNFFNRFTPFLYHFW